MICDSIKVKDPMKVGRFGLGFKSIFHMTGTKFTRQLFSWNVNHQLHGNLHQLTENNCSGFMNGKIICSSFDMSHTFFLSYFVVSLVGLSVRGRGGGLGKACERIWKPRSMFFLTPNLFAKKREKKRRYSYFDDVTIIMSRQREVYQ